MTAVSPQVSVPVVVLAITLCGAIVLFILDVWLRRRGVKDPTLIWLTVSLLSWALTAGVELLPSEMVANSIGLQRDQIAYLFSPISSILFCFTAFRLSRVREFFARTDLKRWPICIVALVALLQMAALVLLLKDQTVAGRTLDATASAIALTVLGAGLIYSFYRYGNQLLAALSGIAFTLLIAMQFIRAAHGPPRGTMAGLQIAGDMMLVILLIALTVAWGLSETSRLRVVGNPAPLTVIALMFDLRGSSAWTHGVIRSDLQYAGTFIDHLRTWAWEKAMIALGERPNLVKFLGDGFLLVWECPGISSEVKERCRRVLEYAYSLHNEYPAWTRECSALWKSTPSALGVGVDMGSAIRLTFENGAEDYMGEPINDAARLQEFARPNGGVLVKADVLSGLGEHLELPGRFPVAGYVELSTESVPVRATEGVVVEERLGSVGEARGTAAVIDLPGNQVSSS